MCGRFSQRSDHGRSHKRNSAHGCALPDHQVTNDRTNSTPSSISTITDDRTKKRRKPFDPRRESAMLARVLRTNHPRGDCPQFVTLAAHESSRSPITPEPKPEPAAE